MKQQYMNIMRNSNYVCVEGILLIRCGAVLIMFLKCIISTLVSSQKTVPQTSLTKVTDAFKSQHSHINWPVDEDSFICSSCRLADLNSSRKEEVEALCKVLIIK